MKRVCLWLICGLLSLGFAACAEEAGTTTSSNALERLGLGEVHALTFSSDGQYLAEATDIGVVLRHRQCCLAGLPYHYGFEVLAQGELYATSVAFSPTGLILAAGYDGGSVRLWDLAAGELLLESSGQSDRVLCVAFSADGTTLASGSGDTDKDVKLWEVPTGSLKGTLTGGHRTGITSLAFSPDGTVLASAGWDGRTVLWDVAEERVRSYLTENGYITLSVSFSPNGKILASGSGNGDIMLWDVSTGELVRTLVGHSSGVRSIAFSPDGLTLASCSSSFVAAEVRLWDLETGTAARILNTAVSINCVAFGPEGTTLAAGSDDGSVLVWDIRGLP
jgi:WD40 repeat protein